MNSKPNNNMIALICVVVGATMTMVIFWASRLDSGLRMAALVFASNMCTAILAISSLLLTGKDVTNNHDKSDLPPGSTEINASSSTVVVPPAIQPVPSRTGIEQELGA